MMRPALNFTNYPFVPPPPPPPFFTNEFSTSQSSSRHFPHSQSYPAFPSSHEVDDFRGHYDSSVSRVMTPVGGSPVQDYSDYYEEERPDTPTFVSGKQRERDNQHYEMIDLVANSLTAEDHSAADRLSLSLSGKSLHVYPNCRMTYTFTERPDLAGGLRTFPLKPADNSDNIIRRNQAVYVAPHLAKVPSKPQSVESDRISSVQIGSSKSPVRNQRVPFNRAMKWTRNAGTPTCADQQLVNGNDTSPPDLEGEAVPQKKSKFDELKQNSSHSDTQRADISNEAEPLNLPEKLCLENSDAGKTFLMTSPKVVSLKESGSILSKPCSPEPSMESLTLPSHSRVDCTQKAYTVPSRNQLSLRNINGKTYKKDSRECFAFASGDCRAGIFCRFDHAGSRAHVEQTVCSRLLKGLCRPNQLSCVSGHGLLEHQYPICSFYLREDCNQPETCQLLHVKHAPATSPCKDFNKGTCFKGVECEDPHRYIYSTIKTKGSYMDAVPEKDASNVPIEDSSVPETVSWIE